MNPDFQRLMNDATRLTQSGDLQAATAAIQAALAGGLPVGAGFAGMPPGPNAFFNMATAPAASAARDTIDIEAREVPDAPDIAHVAPDAPGIAESAPACPAPALSAKGPVPAGGSFVAGSHGTGPSRRDYKLYIPPNAGERALPLVVMLHGCTQNPDDFAAGTGMNAKALAQGFFVLYPAQSQQANQQRCWNWFKHSHQTRGRGEAGVLAGMTREVMARHAIDTQRVYVAGLSAGGAMAAIMGDAYPDLFAAVGVHSGLATGAAKDLPSALAAMQGGGKKTGSAASGMPTIVFHGDADSTVNPANGEQVITASAGKSSSVDVERGKAAGGRAFTRRLHRQADGRVVAEHWRVQGAPHAWSGGSARGSYTDASGPDASAEMIRFFLDHPLRKVH